MNDSPRYPSYQPRHNLSVSKLHDSLVHRWCYWTTITTTNINMKKTGEIQSKDYLSPPIPIPVSTILNFYIYHHPAPWWCSSYEHVQPWGWLQQKLQLKLIPLHQIHAYYSIYNPQDRLRTSTNSYTGTTNTRGNGVISVTFSMTAAARQHRIVDMPRERRHHLCKGVNCDRSSQV